MYKMSQQIPSPPTTQERNIYLKYHHFMARGNNKVRSGILERYTYKSDNGKLLSSTSSNINNQEQIAGPVSNNLPKISTPTEPTINKNLEERSPRKHFVIHQNVMLKSKTRKENEKVRTEHCDSTTDIIENMKKDTVNLFRNEYFESFKKNTENLKFLQIHPSYDGDSDSDCQIVESQDNFSNKNKYPVSKDQILTSNLVKTKEDTANLLLNLSPVHIISDSEEENNETFLCDRSGMEKSTDETNINVESGSSLFLINSFPEKRQISNFTDLSLSVPPELCSTSKILLKTPPKLQFSRLETPQKLNLQIQKVNSQLSPESMKTEFYSYLKINTNPLAQKAEIVAQNRRSVRVKNLISQLEKNRDKKITPEKDKNDVRKKYLKVTKMDTIFPPPEIQHNIISDFNKSILDYFSNENIKHPKLLTVKGKKIEKSKYRTNMEHLRINRNRFINKTTKKSSKNNRDPKMKLSFLNVRRTRNSLNDIRVTRNSFTGYKVLNNKMRARTAKINKVKKKYWDRKKTSEENISSNNSENEQAEELETLENEKSPKKTPGSIFPEFETELTSENEERNIKLLRKRSKTPVPTKPDRKSSENEEQNLTLLRKRSRTPVPTRQEIESPEISKNEEQNLIMLRKRSKTPVPTNPEIKSSENEKLELISLSKRSKTPVPTRQETESPEMSKNEEQNLIMIRKCTKTPVPIKPDRKSVESEEPELISLRKRSKTPVPPRQEMESPEMSKNEEQNLIMIRKRAKTLVPTKRERKSKDIETPDNSFENDEPELISLRKRSKTPVPTKPERKLSENSLENEEQNLLSLRNRSKTPVSTKRERKSLKDIEAPENSFKNEEPELISIRKRSKTPVPTKPESKSSENEKLELISLRKRSKTPVPAILDRQLSEPFENSLENEEPDLIALRTRSKTPVPTRLTEMSEISYENEEPELISLFNSSKTPEFSEKKLNNESKSSRNHAKTPVPIKIDKKSEESLKQLPKTPEPTKSGKKVLKESKKRSKTPVPTKTPENEPKTSKKRSKTPVSTRLEKDIEIEKILQLYCSNTRNYSESEELEFFTTNQNAKVQQNERKSPPFLGFSTEENSRLNCLFTLNSPQKEKNPVLKSQLLEVISIPSALPEDDSLSETSSVQELPVNIQEIIDPDLIESSKANYIPLNQNIKPRSFHKSLTQTCVKQKSMGEATRSSLFELSDSDSSLSAPRTSKGGVGKRGQTHEIDINKHNGAVFNTYYVNDILIIVQELLITFWKQTALGNILGVQNMWLPHGSIQRIILEPGCVNRRSSEMVLSCDNSVAYIELWTKEHKCRFRECPIADVFATIYYHKGHGSPDKKVLQLENIKGYGNDVRFAVIKNSREIIVSWCDTFAKPIKTLVRSYQLAADFQTVCSIKEMEFVSHYISSLHNIHDCSDLVLGAGNEQISVWNLRHGYLVTTLNLSESSPDVPSENKSICLYAQCDTGFLFLIQQTEVGILRLVAVNGMTQEWKQLHSYQVPDNYKKLLGVIVESGVLMTCYTNGFLCWNMHTGEVLAEIDTPNELIVLPSNKYMVAIDNYQVTVQHIMSYILTHDW